MKSGYTAKSITVLAVCAAILIAAQVALSALPNIELVSLLVIIFSKRLGKKALLVIYVFAAVECLIYGFHIWSLTYLYVWTVLYFVARAVGDEPPLFIAAVSGIYGLAFGTLCAIPYFFILGIKGGFATIASGLLFDLVHGAGNFVVALLLYRPLNNAFKKACPAELLV